MASRNGFGAILRNARLKQGYEIDDIAHQLRVRSDIISAIEREDFSRIPPKAYTKNMIASYARIVGVDVDRVTSLFLDDAYSKNLSKARSDMDKFNRINERIVNRAEPSEFDSRPYTSASEVRSSAQSRYEAASRSSERMGRRLYNSRDELEAASTSRPYRSSRSYESERYADDDDYSYGSRYSRAGSRESARYASAGSTRSRVGRGSSERASRSARGVSLYSGGPSMQRRSRRPILIIAFLIIVIIAVIVGVVSCNKQGSDADVSNSNISGLNDPEKVNSGSSVDPTTAPPPIAPSAATFSYQIPEGESVYYEMYYDGEENPSAADTVDGPAHDSIEVTGVLRFVTTNPDGITVRVDGEPVELTQNEKTSWLYECTVDFPAMLEAWKAENLNKPTQQETQNTTNTNQQQSNTQSVTVKTN